ncbi:MAG TPA: sigma-70 family RNA polymerase sigma factor [Herpetosiphonaceae bacterium]|nr:sigma-70 family RNA polymerase sigma factor [Herpetosiphonaceae bacterium]
MKHHAWELAGMELRALISDVRHGNLGAFTELMRRYQDLAFGYAFSILRDFHLAQDAAQEAFIITYFDLQRLQEPDAFPGWLRGIVRFQCYRILRKQQLDLVPFQAALDVASDAKGPDQQVEEQDSLRRVLAVIEALPQQQREVVSLFYIKEFSQQEVAAFLDLPVSTVNNRLHAARKQLKRRMLPMVKDTFKEHGLPESFAANVGRIVQVRGPVIDAQFAPDQLPALLTALTVVDEPRDVELTVQVAQHLGQGKVRCVAISPEVGLMPGMQIVNTGAPVALPVAKDRLLQAVDLLGNANGDGAAAGSARHPARSRSREILETGIKVIDLLCPYTRGGKVAVLGGMGVGKLVVIEEVVHNVTAQGNGVSIFTFVHPGTEISWEREAMRTGSGLGAAQTIVLSADDMIDPAGAAGVFDAVTYMSRDLAQSQIWPAVDPIRSHSQLLDPAHVGQQHYDVARGVRNLLRRYQELRAQAAEEATEGLSQADQTVIVRARRVQRFLAQPFFIAEPYTKRPGAFVSREQTVRDFTAILDGAHDDLPEDAFYFAGTLDEVVERARSMKATA